MVRYFKIIFFVVVLTFGLFSSSSLLRADIATDPYPFVYLFHLYYDNGQLVADRDFEFKYDLIAEPFVPSELNTVTTYRGDVLSVSGGVLGSFKFDPTIVKGKISIKGPYFANAAKVNFYDNQGQLSLMLDVSGSSICNDDGQCNSDTGESFSNCQNDCKLTAPSPSTSPLPINEGGLTSWILIILGIVIGAVVIWMVWIIIKKRKSESSTPPTIPPVVPPIVPPIP